jgi:thimet oligopeptidase
MTFEARGAQDLKERCRAELSALRAKLEGVLLGSRDTAGTLVPLDDLNWALGRIWNLVGFLRCVHPDVATRAAAEEGEQEIARFANEVALNRDLFEAVGACDVSGLDHVGRRMVSHVLRDFRRAGVDRDAATRERVRALREDLVAIGQDFMRNIQTDVRSILLDGPEDLAGLPQDYIDRHPPGPDGRIRITTEYPDYNPFMAYARSAARRQELYKEFRRRAYPANLQVLDRLLAKRHELAGLLGYPSWAAYISEDKMIQRPAAIAAFIERVSAVAGQRAEEEYDVLLAEKRRRDPGAEEVADWEKAYHEELVRTDRFRVDSKEVRAYFTYGRVKAGILSLAEDLFGIRFRPGEAATAWHPDVEVLDVVEDGKPVGRIYLDMHPRPGKFQHAAMFPLVAGVRGKALPEAALVCNFPDPREGNGAALLEHDDVVTFFHEFGHLLHHLFAGNVEWGRFSGTATEWDFVEVPSQLFEEWAWDHEALGRFAVHHRTGETIPRDLVGRMRKARNFGRALWVRHQMFYAAVSLRCYAADPAGLDTSWLIADLQNRYSLFRFVDGTYFQASFGHLDDYSALYYTYMWSLVIEKDIFEAFLEEGVMSRNTAARYRKEILAPGGSGDAADLVRGFLGRDYTFQAFESWLHQG